MTIDTNKNKSICSYPFTHSYIGPKYERRLCCISEDVVELPKTSLIEFWNSDKMKETRLKMINGEKVKECSTCYYFENSNISSLRKESTDYLNIEDLTKHMNSDGSMNMGPSFYDHRTIHCNLQCISCGHAYSSTHEKLFKMMWHRNPSDFKVDFEYEDSMANDINDSIIKKECTKLYWAGGEPMSSHVHWSVVEKMYELSQVDEYKDYVKNIGVHYNTNMTKLMWKGKPIPELLDFYQPSIQASLDGTHETFEYTRDGAKWDEVSKNWDEYYKVLNKHNQFSIASVLSAPVVFDIDRWFDFYEKYDPILHNHKYFCDTTGNPGNINGMLDIRLFPIHIMKPAVEHAIDRFEKSKLRNKEKTVQILSSYINEYYEQEHVFTDLEIQRLGKTRVLYRDKFLKTSRSFQEVLQISNPKASEWFINL